MFVNQGRDGYSLLQPNRLLLNWLNSHEIKIKDAAQALKICSNDLRQLATMRSTDVDLCAQQARIVGRLRKVLHVR